MARFASWRVRWGYLSIFLVACFSLTHLSIALWLVELSFEGILAKQSQAGLWMISAVYLGMMVFNCFIEWFTHRLLLHSKVVSWLSYLCDRHRNHHRLTAIKFKRIEDGSAMIKSVYPITQDKQYESVSFPFYTLASFLAFLTIPLGLAQLIFPEAPFILGGYSAVATSFFFYEVIHPLEHKPDEWWEKRKNNPFLSLVWRVHQYHHLRSDYNMAIAGFFGLPLADMALGTFKLPKRPLQEAAITDEKELEPPKPIRLVVWIDSWSQNRARRLFMEGVVSAETVSE
ncbi:MAG: hypothetical protein HY506_02750 [Candidatus Yanofskybacteria bacterium]|nr:hypothetical protein [Candidatus Yanofskybacteria bacterium]